MKLGLEKAVRPCDSARLSRKILMSPRMPIACRVQALLHLRGKGVASASGCCHEANNIVPRDEVVEVFKRMVRISKSKKKRGRRQRQRVAEAEQNDGLTWEACSRMALQHVDTTTSFRMANIINCCKKGGYFDQRLLNALFARAMDFDLALIHEFSSVEVSMTIQSLGMLSRGARHTRRHQPPDRHQGGTDASFRASCKDFVHALMVECTDRNLFSDERYDIRELSNTIHGLGLVENDVSGPDIRRCVDQLVEEFSTKVGERGACVGLDFSQLLHGCAKLGYRDERRMFEVCELLKWSLSSHAMFEDRTLGTISWALGKLGVRDHELMEMLGEQIVERIGELTTRGLASVIYAYGLAGFRSDFVLEALGREIVKDHRLSRCNAQDLSNAMYGFGLLGYDDPAVLAPLAREIADGIGSRQHTMQSLANIMYGMGKSKCFEADAVAKLLKESELQLQGCSNHSLTLIPYGLALLADDCRQHLPGSVCRFLEAVSRELLARKQRGGLTLNLQDTSTLAWSMGALGFYDKELLAVLYERYLGLVDAGAKPMAKGVDMMLSACASLDFECAKFFQFFEQWSERRWGGGEVKGEGRLSICQLSKEMWARALCGRLTATTFETLSDRLSEVRLEEGRQPLCMEDCQRIVQSWLYVTVVLGKPCRGSSCLLAAEAKQEWTSNVDVSKSRFERDVCRILDDLGVAYQSQELLLEGLIPVDVYVAGDAPVVFECDGPSHYTVNRPCGKSRQMGRTRFRNRLLEASGMKVVCVPYFMRECNRRSLISKTLQESGHL